MTTNFRMFTRVLGAVAIVAVSATPAFGQGWRGGPGGPPGRSVRVEQGRARPCPPGHQRKGWCGWTDARRNRDWCWDRNHDARCDRVTARVDRRWDDRRARDNRWPGGWENERVRNRRDLPDRGTLSGGVAEILRRAGMGGYR